MKWPVEDTDKLLQDVSQDFSSNLLILHCKSENDSRVEAHFLLPRYWGVPGSSCILASLVPASLCTQQAPAGPSGLCMSEWTKQRQWFTLRNTGIVIREGTHIDDDVMAFIFQSHAELEFWVIDEVHILLQHLQIMGKPSEVHAGMGREETEQVYYNIETDIHLQGRCSSAGCPPPCESQWEIFSWCILASFWCWTDYPHQTRISTSLLRQELWEYTAFLQSATANMNSLETLWHRLLVKTCTYAIYTLLV